MKYIRTEDGVYEIERYYEPRDYYWVKQNCEQPIGSDEIIKQADTIEELCDMFVGYIDIDGNKEDLSIKMSDDLNDFNAIDRFMFTKEGELYGAIWTDKGLIYVAKMNDKGELELL